MTDNGYSNIKRLLHIPKGATESFPFGEDTLVFKVKDKIFALVNLEGDLSINLKCDPAFAIELRKDT